MTETPRTWTLIRGRDADTPLLSGPEIQPDSRVEVIEKGTTARCEDCQRLSENIMDGYCLACSRAALKRVDAERERTLDLLEQTVMWMPARFRAIENAQRVVAEVKAFLRERGRLPKEGK